MHKMQTDIFLIQYTISEVLATKVDMNNDFAAIRAEMIHLCSLLFLVQ